MGMLRALLILSLKLSPEQCPFLHDRHSSSQRRTLINCGLIGKRIAPTADFDVGESKLDGKELIGNAKGSPWIRGFALRIS